MSNKPDHVQVSGAECACGRCHDVREPTVVETVKMAGVERSETSVLRPESALPNAVLTALETRAMLLAAEQVCEEIGAKLSGQIRDFSAEELLAYGKATSGEDES